MVKSPEVHVTVKIKGDKIKKQLGALAAYLEEYMVFLDKINSLTLQARDQLRKLLKKATQADKFFDLEIKPVDNKSCLDKKNDDCVLCGEETAYSKDTSVEYREHYIEEAGQLCPGCYKKVYG